MELQGPQSRQHIPPPRQWLSSPARLGTSGESGRPSDPGPWGTPGRPSDLRQRTVPGWPNWEEAGGRAAPEGPRPRGEGWQRAWSLRSPWGREPWPGWHRVQACSVRWREAPGSRLCAVGLERPLTLRLSVRLDRRLPAALEQMEPPVPWETACPGGHAHRARAWQDRVGARRVLWGVRLRCWGRGRWGRLRSRLWRWIMLGL